jgi:hypothetical protein
MAPATKNQVLRFPRKPIFLVYRPGWLIVLACCSVSGCGGGTTGPERASVSGRITVDGRPLVNGSLRFVPVQGTSGPVAGAVVQNGSYSTSRTDGPVVGTNRVEIEGVCPTGKKVRTVMGELIDEYAQVVPEQYNTKSTLVRTVSPRKNVFDFLLTSK